MEVIKVKDIIPGKHGYNVCVKVKKNCIDIINTNTIKVLNVKISEAKRNDGSVLLIAEAQIGVETGVADARIVGGISFRNWKRIKEINDK